MSMDALTDDEKSLLTEEELAGLDEEDAQDAGNDGDDGDDGADGEPEEEPELAADPAPAHEPAADPAPTADPDDDDDDLPADPAPAGERLDPQAVQQQLDDIARQRKELATKLDDGDLTTSEFTAAIDKLNDQKHDITAALAEQERSEKAVIERWETDCRRFLGKNSDVTASPARLQAFDSVVRRVTGDPDNATLSNRKQLEKAHALWKEEMGFDADPGAAPKDKQPAPPKPKPKTEIPPTLAHVPAADINDADDGKYSHLDALLHKGDAVAYEAALARLSDAEQDDYLSRA